MKNWNNSDFVYDLVHLKEKDEYFRYVAKGRLIFKILENIYKLKIQRDNEAEEESKIVLSYIDKIIYTFEVLRIKYLYNQNDTLKIDKSDSGFINFSEISFLERDLKFAEKKLEKLRETYTIKSEMLSFMLHSKEEPKELLEEMAERQYYSLLDKERLFLFFNHGDITLKSQNRNSRKYFFHWSTYDKLSNMPYIYLLEFEQDIKSQDLTKENSDSKRFMDVIKSEGSRAPAIGIVAMAIDQRLEDIHPKMLKRVCIGPIYSKNFSTNIDKELEEFLSIGDKGERFVFYLTEQFVFSSGEYIVQNAKELTSILEKKRIREKFYIPKPKSVKDYAMFNELEEQKASLIRKNIIIPYKLHQHLDTKFQGYKIISFNKEGEINGV